MAKKEEKEGNETFTIFPIGYVWSAKKKYYLEILEPYRPALKHLEHFSHVIVLWWAHKRDNEKYRSMLQTKPPYAKEKLTGVFACRAEYRPNPIMMTTSQIVAVNDEKGVVQVAYMDAHNGTPIVDLKGYFSICDRVKEPHIPEWLADWPEWLPE